MEEHVLKALLDRTTKNVTTMIEYSKNTREIVRECQETIDALHRLISQQNETIAQLKTQLQSVQGIVFRGGTS